MEGDGLGLDLSLLDVDLVAAQNNGDVLADTDEITCKWYVSNTSCHGSTCLRWDATYDASWGRSCR